MGFGARRFPKKLTEPLLRHRIIGECYLTPANGFNLTGLRRRGEPSESTQINIGGLVGVLLLT
jgi:hypothetical protein